MSKVARSTWLVFPDSPSFGKMLLGTSQCDSRPLTPRRSPMQPTAFHHVLAHEASRWAWPMGRCDIFIVRRNCGTRFSNMAAGTYPGTFSFFPLNPNKTKKKKK